MTYMSVDELGGIKEMVDGILGTEAKPPPEEPAKFPWLPVIIGTLSLAMLVTVTIISSRKRSKV